MKINFLLVAALTVYIDLPEIRHNAAIISSSSRMNFRFRNTAATIDNIKAKNAIPRPPMVRDFKISIPMKKVNNLIYEKTFLVKKRTYILISNFLMFKFKILSPLLHRYAQERVCNVDISYSFSFLFEILDLFEA